METKDLKFVNERVTLSDGRTYLGWGYYDVFGNFIPHGFGKKFYDGFYLKGNFRDGEECGPAINSHNYYMYTSFFSNHRANGWGLCMNSGEIVEFGYYKDSKLQENLIDFVGWYVEKMKEAATDDDMITIYSHKETHQVVELFFGYPGKRVSDELSTCFVGFRFKEDGSVWVGTTGTRKLSGYLLHFRKDGYIDAGKFEDGELVERMDLQEIIDNYFGTWSFEDDDLDIFAEMMRYKKNDNPRAKTREQYRNIDDIIPNHCYIK